MAIKKGDILDERKRHPESCGLVVKIMGGGAGFEKVVCCGHDLTEDDVVAQMGSPLGRRKGDLPLAVILDEKKLFPDSCGLRVMVMDGGAGFKEIRCCGHSLTLSSVQELKFGQLRGGQAEPAGQPGFPGPPGTA
jgi:hypothetical protein